MILPHAAPGGLHVAPFEGRSGKGLCVVWHSNAARPLWRRRRALGMGACALPQRRGAMDCCGGRGGTGLDRGVFHRQQVELSAVLAAWRSSRICLCWASIARLWGGAQRTLAAPKKQICSPAGCWVITYHEYCLMRWLFFLPEGLCMYMCVCLLVPPLAQGVMAKGRECGCGVLSTAFCIPTALYNILVPPQQWVIMGYVHGKWCVSLLVQGILLVHAGCGRRCRWRLKAEAHVVPPSPRAAVVIPLDERIQKHWVVKLSKPRCEPF